MSDARDGFPKVEDIFDPNLYNDAELKTLLKLELGISPVVLMDDVDLAEDGKITVRPALQRFFDLEEIREHRDHEWAGVDTVKESCQLMLDYREQYQAHKARSGVGFHPSMHTFDSRNRAKFGGIGSDSGRVRTYLSKDGKRVKFAVALTEQGGEHQWVFSSATVDSSWGNLSEVEPGAVIVLIERFKGDTGIFECPICGEAETFSRDDSSTESRARHKMGVHCKTAKNEQEAHLLLFDEINA